MIMLLDFVFTATGFKKHFFSRQYIAEIQPFYETICFSNFIYVLICVYQKPFIGIVVINTKAKNVKKMYKPDQ